MCEMKGTVNYCKKCRPYSPATKSRTNVTIKFSPRRDLTCDVRDTFRRTVLDSPPVDGHKATLLEWNRAGRFHSGWITVEKRRNSLGFSRTVTLTYRGTVRERQRSGCQCARSVWGDPGVCGRAQAPDMKNSCLTYGTGSSSGARARADRYLNRSASYPILSAINNRFNISFCLCCPSPTSSAGRAPAALFHQE